MKTYTLLKTIPSHSHNAPYSADLGNHWPAGQQFKNASRSAQQCYGRTGRALLEQIGGEEVLLMVPRARMAELFG